MQIEIDLNKIRENGIFLMLPVYGGQSFMAFGQSLMQLTALCAQYSIPMETFFIYNESLVTRARNYCVDEFLRKTFKTKLEDGSIVERPYQHAMFIDSDIEFNPMDVLVMAHHQNLDPKYHVVCGPYPKKQIAWEKIKIAVDKGFADEDPDRLADFVGDYVFNVVGSGKIKLNEPAEVHESGTGFMMIRREVFERVLNDNPDIEYRPDHVRTANFDGSRKIGAYFDTSIDPDTERYLSEDYHFCKLVRSSGMKVWLLPWIQLKHHGYYVFGGSLSAMAALGVPTSSDPTKVIKK